MSLLRFFALRTKLLPKERPFDDGRRVRTWASRAFSAFLIFFSFFITLPRVFACSLRASSRAFSCFCCSLRSPTRALFWSRMACACSSRDCWIWNSLYRIRRRTRSSCVKKRYRNAASNHKARTTHPLLAELLEPLRLALLLLVLLDLAHHPPPLREVERRVLRGLILLLLRFLVLLRELERAADLLYKLGQFAWGLRRDGLDVALEDEEVLGFDEDV